MPHMKQKPNEKDAKLYFSELLTETEEETIVALGYILKDHVKRAQVDEDRKRKEKRMMLAKKERMLQLRREREAVEQNSVVVDAAPAYVVAVVVAEPECSGKNNPAALRYQISDAGNEGTHSYGVSMSTSCSQSSLSVPEG